MTSRHNTHIPGKGDKVWVDARRDAGKQPNGYVRQIFWDEQQIEVKYHDSEGHDMLELFEFEDFRHCFTDAFGGIWMLGSP